ncbi:MAG: adenylyl-sulfate kinase [Candidatus Adiutrix sp.]|jgi:adenylylsulfate kinase-like enzyme|nr:adenylyl-sulfate kinase [Candidatus Adiutrix sp.]
MKNMLSPDAPGRVYWITGLSGAGKTTIGVSLYYRLKSKRPQTALLDGDVMKLIFDGEKVDYSPASRLIRSKKYAHLCQYLAGQGFTVICCAIAMYDETRAWNRKNIPNYVEVFIDVDLETLVRTDPKGHYRSQGAAMVGLGDKVELPKNPDLIIRNDRKLSSIEAYVDQILRIGECFSPEETTRLYWNSYYAAKKKPAGPSDFAVFVSDYLKPEAKLIDLGCGDGRDSLYFQSQSLIVNAVDSAREAIRLIDAQNVPIFAVCDDFVKAKALFCVDYAYAYARWSIHVVSLDQQRETLKNVHHALIPGGLFFIEVRTVNDAKYGLGQALEDDAFLYDGHYRRFIRPEDFLRNLREQGFTIKHQEESDRFSVVGDDRPVLLRVVASKA